MSLPSLRTEARQAYSIWTFLDLPAAGLAVAALTLPSQWLWQTSSTLSFCGTTTVLYG